MSADGMEPDVLRVSEGDTVYVATHDTNGEIESAGETFAWVRLPTGLSVHVSLADLSFARLDAPQHSATEEDVRLGQSMFATVLHADRESREQALDALPPAAASEAMFHWAMRQWERA